MKLAIMTVAVVMAVAAHSDTVAWWHFDEGEPGAKAVAGTIAPDQAPDLYATPEAMSGTTVYAAGSADYEASAYAPTYTKPFRGRVIYDPVSDTYRTNSAALRFSTARGEYAAYYGGCLKIPGAKSLYAPIEDLNRITVEAFVCTTGGSYNTFGPIAGSVSGDFLAEDWAICTEEEGQIFVRFMGGIYRGNVDPNYKKVNDGAWHHVALTYDGAKVSVYVDHELDRSYDSTATLGFGDNNATYIGGYDTFYNYGYGCRRFPGVIDEVRVSNAALTPAQFLRMRPSADTNVILQISFDPDEYETSPSMAKNQSDAIDPDFQKTFLNVFTVFPEYDASVKAGATVGCGFADDCGIANASAIHFVTNGIGGGSFLRGLEFSNRLVGHPNYTVECFYKSGGQVRGSTLKNRQTLFKLGSDTWLVGAELTWATEYQYMGSGALRITYMDKTLVDAGESDVFRYDGTSDTNLDDGNWHHLAIVIDGDNGEARTYVDGRLSVLRTGYVPATIYNYSIYIGNNALGGGWFDGWVDNFRVTLRALSPSEFLAANPTGAGDASLLALFEENYDFACAQNAAYSVTGTGEARTGGNAPVFAKDSNYDLLLDGTNGINLVKNQYSVYLDRSRIAFPPSDLLENASCTVEFWAKFTGIVDENGAVAADSTSLTDDAPIMSFVPADSPSDRDWHFSRAKDNAEALRIAMDGSSGVFVLPDIVVDGKWHHYALTFEPVNNATNTQVSLWYDYALMGSHSSARALPRRVSGHWLVLGEGPSDEPNLQFKMDSLRFSKGVLPPEKFLVRVPRGLMLIFK